MIQSRYNRDGTIPISIKFVNRRRLRLRTVQIRKEKNMEELLKAMGYKSVNDMSLEEIRTRISDYKDFMTDIEEISEIMENNTGLGLLLSELGEPERYSLDEIKYGLERRGDYRPLAEALLLIWQKVNAKMGEISFFIDSDLDGLNFRETEILDDMEQSSAIMR